MGNKISLQFFQAKKEKYEDNQLTKVDYWVEVLDSQKTDKPKEENPKLSADVLNKELATFLTSTISAIFHEATSALSINIGFVDNQMLNDSLVFDRLLKNPDLRQTTNSRSRRFDSPYHPKPIIFVGIDSLMELENHIGTHENFEEGSLHAQKDFIKKIHRRIDSRFRMMDASIWNRYISLIPVQSFESRFKKLVQEIVKYHEQGLYHSIVAQEYLEFSCRKLRESYVKNYPGGHAKKVTPFRFHSESRMKEMAKKKRKEISSYTWSVLVVDDFSAKPLRPMHKRHEGKISNKRSWIDVLINESSPTSNLITFIPIPHLEKGQNANIGFYYEMLKNSATRPDIIILDYFFGIEERDPEQQYGHKFIKRLLEAEKDLDAFNKRAFEKYWIFPISAFEHAFRSHLRLMGTSPGNELIEIGDGADPINSPELFKYLFYSFLAYQKQTVLPGLKKLLTDILDACRESSSPLKQVIKDEYSKIISLIAKAVQIKQECLFQTDSSQKNDLAHCFFKNLNEEYFTENFLFHIQGLVSLIAHGSSWDWPRMWEEYLFIVDLKAKIVPSTIELTENHKHLNTVLDKTKDYIIDLKNQIQ